MDMKPANIELHIEALVLYGFALSDRYRIGAAVERELARLVAEYGVPPSLAQNSHVARLDGRAFEAGPHAKPETIGVQIAQAVYERLGQ